MKKIILLVVTLTFLGSCAHQTLCSCGSDQACGSHQKKSADGSKQDEECSHCKGK